MRVSKACFSAFRVLCRRNKGEQGLFSVFEGGSCGNKEIYSSVCPFQKIDLKSKVKLLEARQGYFSSIKCTYIQHSYFASTRGLEFRAQVKRTAYMPT